MDLWVTGETCILIRKMLICLRKIKGLCTSCVRVVELRSWVVWWAKHGQLFVQDGKYHIAGPVDAPLNY